MKPVNAFGPSTKDVFSHLKRQYQYWTPASFKGHRPSTLLNMILANTATGAEATLELGLSLPNSFTRYVQEQAMTGNNSQTPKTW